LADIVINILLQRYCYTVTLFTVGIAHQKFSNRIVLLLTDM